MHIELIQKLLNIGFLIFSIYFAIKSVNLYHKGNTAEAIYNMAFAIFLGAGK